MEKNLWIGIVFLLGICVLGYPSFSNYLMQKNGSKLLEGYSQSVSELEQEALEKIKKEALIYNENLLGNPVHDPFLKDSGAIMPENYQEVLNVQESMGSVEIPKIAVDLPIYHGTSDDVLRKGIGHLEGSTLPIGGAETHAVLTGHTGATHAKLFTDLPLLVEGDLFYLHILDEVLAYKIDQIQVIRPEEVTAIKRETGKDLCTLLTCTPYGVNSHRLLVRGIRVPYEPEAKEQIAKATLLSINKTVLIVGIATTVIMLDIGIGMVRRKKKELSDEEE